MKAGRPIRNSALALAIAVFASAIAHAEELEDVAVVTKTGCHIFKSEIADTAMERSKGLMFRTRLAPDGGMLFDFGETRTVAMWMKNTFVPLDMIFIARDGAVVAVVENTVPQSTDIISPAPPAYSVLEVLAGTVDRINVEPGDRVEHRIFATQSTQDMENPTLGLPCLSQVSSS